jgi:Brp/Blh family beta-carotene 15,15'-monooxygenase
MNSSPGLAMVRNEGAPVRGIYPSAGAVVPAGEPYIAGLHIAATGAALILAAAGVNLAGGATTILWCAVILVLGLPHGALDMASLLAARSTVGAFGAYLAVAGAMAALWWVVPGSALIIFFALAIGHFGEDWPGPGLVAHGAALALLAAPLLFHRSEVDALFSVIAGSGALPPLSDSLVLVAPVAMAAGLTACMLWWAAGRHMLAVSSALALAGMIVLPPLVGFVLSFGLLHSPRQFARGLKHLKSPTWVVPVVSASAAGLMLAITVAHVGAGLSPSGGAVRGTFIVLSVLTVPHMMLPFLLRHSSRSRSETSGVE